MTMTYTKKRRAIAFRVVAHHKPYSTRQAPRLCADLPKVE